MVNFFKVRLERLLRWSERYTKTDMVYLATNGIWLSIGQVCLALIALGLSVAFAHFVSKETYGTYRFLLSFFWILTAFSLTGLPPAFARAIARGKDGAYAQALRLSLAWGAPMAFVSLGVALYYYLQGNMGIALGSVIIAIIGPLMQGAYLYGAFLEGKKAFRTNAIAGIVLNSVPALTLFVTMFFSHEPLVFLAVYLGSNVLTGTVISYVVYKLYHVPGASGDESLMHLSGHYSAMNILLTVSQQLDRLLVFHFLGAAQLAIYVFATALPDQIKSLLNSVSTLAFPKFVNRSLKEILPTLHHRMRTFTVLIALGALVYIGIAPLAFHILFPTYGESIIYSQLYALTLITLSSIIPVSLFQAHGAKQELYIYNITSPLFQMLVLFALIPLYGLMGAIIARVIGRIFTVVLSSILLQRYATRSSQ